MNKNIKVGDVTLTPEMIEAVAQMQSKTDKQQIQNTLDDMMHVLVIITSIEEVSHTLPQISRCFGNVSDFLCSMRDALPATE